MLHMILQEVASVNLNYVKGSYMDEIMVDGRPFLVYSRRTP